MSNNETIGRRIRKVASSIFGFRGENERSNYPQSKNKKESASSEEALVGATKKEYDLYDREVITGDIDEFSTEPFSRADWGPNRYDPEINKFYGLPADHGADDQEAFNAWKARVAAKKLREKERKKQIRKGLRKSSTNPQNTNNAGFQNGKMSLRRWFGSWLGSEAAETNGPSQEAKSEQDSPPKLSSAPAKSDVNQKSPQKENVQGEQTESKADIFNGCDPNINDPVVTSSAEADEARKSLSGQGSDSTHEQDLRELRTLHKIVSAENSQPKTETFMERRRRIYWNPPLTAKTEKDG